jgi:hypothetical protein
VGLLQRGRNAQFSSGPNRRLFRCGSGVAVELHACFNIGFSKSKGTQMATWRDFKAVINEHFKVLDNEERHLSIGFHLDEGRSQVVHMFPGGNAEIGEWVHIESPVGKLDSIDLRKALELIEGAIIGGLAVAAGDLVTVRHSVALANVDLNEIIIPIKGVCFAADELEQQLTGKDQF